MVEEGLPVYIECTSSGNPYPTFTWFRGTTLNESISSATDTRYTLSGGRFTIAEPKNDDVNSYRCLATNDIGTVMSKIARIQFGCKLLLCRIFQFFVKKCIPTLKSVVE